MFSVPCRFFYFFKRECFVFLKNYSGVRGPQNEPGVRCLLIFSRTSVRGLHKLADRNAVALYDFPGQDVTTHFITEMPLRVSSTRGLGAYANVFAIESFIDELAHATGSDPVAYRLRFMKDPRARDAITRAAEAFGWAAWKKTPGRGRGIGFARALATG